MYAVREILEALESYLSSVLLKVLLLNHHEQMVLHDSLI